MSQLPVLSGKTNWPKLSEERRRMDGARTSTLASLRGSIERLEAHGDAHASQQGRAWSCERRMRCCAAGSRVAAVHEVFAEGHQGAAAHRVHRRPRGADRTAQAAGLGAAGFCRTRIRRAVDERALRAWPRSAARRHRARRRCRVRVADHSGRARLRCARRRRAGSLWGETRQLDLVASRKLTLAAQASGVTALLLRVAAEPAALDCGDAMDRARGAFAAVSSPRRLECLGRAGVRRATRS